MRATTLPLFIIHLLLLNGNGMLTMGEDEVRRTWKDDFEDPYNVDTQRQVVVHVCGFEGVQRGN